MAEFFAELDELERQVEQARRRHELARVARALGLNHRDPSPRAFGRKVAGKKR